VHFICDNESTVIIAKRPITDSIFNNVKCDSDLIVTSNDLLENWCSNMSIKFHWVNGHAYLLNRLLLTDERLFLVVYLHADDTIRSARGAMAAPLACT
jgi:hypothetical protein